MPPPGGGGGDDGYHYVRAYRRHLIAARLEEKYAEDLGAWAALLRDFQALKEPARVARAFEERLRDGRYSARIRA